MDIDKIIRELSHLEKKVLLALQKYNNKASPQDLIKSGDFSQEVEIMNAASWLQSKKLILLEQELITLYSLGKEGKRFLEKGLPEKRALAVLQMKNGKASLSELQQYLEPDEIPIAIGWLKHHGWATIKKEKETIFEITEKGKKALNEKTIEENLLQELSVQESLQIDPKKLQSLLSRKNVIKEKQIVKCTLKLTDSGQQVLKKGFSIQEEITQITTSVIKNNEWKQKIIRPYDIHAFAPALYGGKPHPLIQLIGQIRQIFLEMGFQEIQGNYVESCFWNMDVLFIPQDHPARDMQDTLYCQKPLKIPISDSLLLERIAEVHENGGTTQSTGWGYKFSKSEGEKALLRTHTTVNTIQYLYHNPYPPAKIFSVGRVFRKESIDATHLPEFHQIEGIIHEESTNFRQLIGVLTEFYHRMGFEKIRFRPGYFPYTEPSMEIEVFYNNKWMELGGSGMFRPEVTEPLGITTPVLAWGLGLERLAMLKFGLTDIRSLYISDLAWLQKKSML
ncbi:MAG: phenylalanine--tRNA ligase subunit alpha [Candidatus Thermoplasmatota archaeon]